MTRLRPLALLYALASAHAAACAVTDDFEAVECNDELGSCSDCIACGTRGPCQQEFDDCTDEEACGDLLACEVECDPMGDLCGCYSTCEGDHPAGVKPLADWEACNTLICPMQCTYLVCP